VQRGRETILVVEDEAAILEVTTMILSRLGYRVLPAHSPDAALALAREHAREIHLLVTDVVMPGMNCLELAVKL
jgi:two-component system, cell cycle sensor histidine kinase and response regulator CckA